MEELYTIHQSAVALKVHPITIRRYIKEGKLKAYRAGGNIRVSLTDLKVFTQSFVPRTKTKEFPDSIEANFSFSDPLFRLKGRGIGANSASNLAERSR